MSPTHDEEDFAETVQGEPVFGDDDLGVENRPSSGARSVAPAEAADATALTPLAKIAEETAGPVGPEPAHAPLEIGEDKFAATALDGFTRGPEGGKGDHSAPSSGARQPQSRPRPLGPPPPQSDAPLYAALALVIVLIVAILVGLAVAVFFA